jgi:hypothetical protein
VSRPSVPAEAVVKQVAEAALRAVAARAEAEAEAAGPLEAGVEGAPLEAEEEVLRVEAEPRVAVGVPRAAVERQAAVEPRAAAERPATTPSPWTSRAIPGCNRWVVSSS